MKVTEDLCVLEKCVETLQTYQRFENFRIYRSYETVPSSQGTAGTADASFNPICIYTAQPFLKLRVGHEK